METKNTRPIFPWYKERLQTKCLKAPTNKLSTVSGCWHFVNTMSLDEPGGRSSALPGAHRGVSPVIFQSAQHLSCGPKPRKTVSKEHACFSKQMIQKQIRREYVASVEEKLKRHPLTTFPHYKDHMTPELFEQVVSVLDPDMCTNGTSAPPAPTGSRAEEEDEEDCREPSEEEVDRLQQGASAHEMQAHWHFDWNVNGIKKGSRGHSGSTEQP